jgi:hypothetical protein
MSKYLLATADISEDGVHRYKLTRVWDDKKGTALFIGLNPSTADGEVDDPTIRRMVGFAKDWGMGSIVVVNLFSYRATDPEKLRSAFNPCGEQNNRTILKEAFKASKIICCWGGHKYAKRRAKQVLRFLSSYTALCLGVTKDGSPRHPLYIRSGTELEIYHDKKKHKGGRLLEGRHGSCD